MRRGHPSSAEIGAIGCDYIVAADGAGSLMRGAAGVGLSGRRELGHLVNVHFRCLGLGHLMKKRGQQAGMLSFVFNEVRSRYGAQRIAEKIISFLHPG